MIAHSSPFHQSNTENRKNSVKKFIFVTLLRVIYLECDFQQLSTLPGRPQYIFLCQRNKTKVEEERSKTLTVKKIAVRKLNSNAIIYYNTFIQALFSGSGFLSLCSLFYITFNSF